MADWRSDDRDTDARQELIRRARQRLERKGRRGLRRRVPRPRRPEQEIRQYRAVLRDIRRTMEREIRDRVFPEIETFLQEAGTREDSTRLDDWSDRIADLFLASRSALGDTVEDAQQRMDSLGDRVVERATEDQIRQVRAVMGVSPSFYDQDKVTSQLNSWKRQNQAFITRFTDDEIEAAQDAVQRGVRSGRSTKDIQSDLRKRFGISDRRAERIARTEISQLNAQITRERQRELGLDRYIWRHSDDERVRGNPDGRYPDAEPSHWERSGEKFSWDDPPEGGHPGESVMCRCTAESDVSGLLDDLEST